MALFLSTFQNKIDKKGRVSIPAQYRSVLVRQEFPGIVAYNSFVNASIEACGMDRIEKIGRRLAELDPYSDEYDALSTTILGGSQQLAFDGEGRVSLPADLMEAAQLSTDALFVGKGETFEIWEPAAFRIHAAKARELAQKSRGQIRGNNTGENA